ncbi:MAG: hypothetical protein IJW09_07215 [Clostridia bacterium]|nr:hypothetical protein [Clostridia bacterium]MBR2621237.1 hypothetical protein [Clostridia bacterium]
MIFQNVSSVPVLLTVQGQEIQLAPGESQEIVCDQNIMFTLRHVNKSTSLSEDEIVKDMSNGSIVATALSSYHPPYFHINLDSTYHLNNEEMSLVQIRQQELSPCYGVMYDRLYPVISSGTITEVNYSFSEKAEFTELYLRASHRSHRAGRIFKKILIVLGIIAIPIVAVATLFGGILGLLKCVLSLAPVAVPCAMVGLLSKISERIDGKKIENFENEKIKKNFSGSFKEF